MFRFNFNSTFTILFHCSTDVLFWACSCCWNSETMCLLAACIIFFFFLLLHTKTVVEISTSTKHIMQICIWAAVSIMLSQRLYGLEMQNARQIKYTYFVHSTTICSALCSMYCRYLLRTMGQYFIIHRTDGWRDERNGTEPLLGGSVNIFSSEEILDSMRFLSMPWIE